MCDNVGAAVTPASEAKYRIDFFKFFIQNNEYKLFQTILGLQFISISLMEP